jgi:PAS domain S-box-containing protein
MTRKSNTEQYPAQNEADRATQAEKNRQEEAQQWLIRNVERFKNLAEMLPETVYELDLHGRFIFFNDQAIEMTGYSRVEFESGLSFIDIFVPEDRSRVVGDIVKTTRGEMRGEVSREGTGETSYTLLKKDGATFPVAAKSTPIVRDGQISGIRGILVDITEQKRAQEVLLRSREQLEIRVAERTAELHRVNKDLIDEIMERRRTEQELEQYKNHLEELVEERKAELEATQNRLLDASRRAGMAEVATSVLHNVGNVLNSVNVAANLIRDTVSMSRIDGLERAVELLEEHEDDLVYFLTHDDKGKQLTLYLGQLHRIFKADRNEILDKAGDLCKKVDHINQIIMLQQSYGTVRGVWESCKLSDLLEDAIQINSESLNRQGAVIKRDFQTDLVVQMERQKVIEILVNLIGNASQAMEQHDQIDSVLTMRFRHLLKNAVRVEVEDNGVGISEENQTRIFAHGFTTRNQGHGFGLHASAIAAKELGGTLTAQSEGPGKGATFILEIPTKKP